MEEARWKKIETIFNETISLPVEERAQFLRQTCLPDTELLEEISALLGAETIDSNFLNSTAFTLGANILSAQGLPQSEIFAEYRLIKLLGRGGMGVVFLAEDTRLKRLVAVKLLTPTLWENNDSESRFQQEAQAASHVSHQNIAHIYEYGEYDGQLYLAMEYVPGKTLREIMKEGSADQDKAIGIVVQMLDALSAAHRQGIIHRDIKPENIIISEDGIVKVLDFGLAKQNARTTLDRNTSEIAIVETTPGLIIGTAGYMSPEQVRGQPTEERTDLWSVGVVLYELLSGFRPFTGETSNDVYASILRDSVPQRIDCPKALKRIIIKSLQKNPADRIQTAAEFSRELRGLRTIDSTQSSLWKIHKFKPLIVSLIVLSIFVSAMAFYLGRIPTNKKVEWNDFLGVSEDDGKKIESLAIVPFMVRSSAKNGDRLNHFSNEMAAALIEGIGGADVCLVKSLIVGKEWQEVKSIRFKNEAESFTTVLRGEITENDGDIQIAIRLISMESDETLWQDDLRFDGKSLLEIRAKLLLLITENIWTFIGNGKKKVYILNPTKSETAYSLYAKATYEYSWGIEKQLANISALREALREDSTFALAYLALAKIFRDRYPKSAMDAAIENELTKDYAMRSLMFGGELAGAYVLLAQVAFENREWKTFIEKVQRAREINPNIAWPHLAIGKYLLPLSGQLRGAETEIEKAILIHPVLIEEYTTIAHLRVMRGDSEGALEALKRYVPENGRQCSICFEQSITLAKLGKLEEAVKDASGIADIEERYLETDQQKKGTALAIVHGLAGNQEEAIKALRYHGLASKPYPNYVSPYHLAMAYALVGEGEYALENLEKSVKWKQWGYLLSLPSESVFDTLRSDPRFIKVQAEVSIPHDLLSNIRISSLEYEE